jgi:hypothetical protein
MAALYAATMPIRPHFAGAAKRARTRRTATFFPIGKHAMWHPEILKQVAEQGHSIGTHTWSHANLATKSFDEGKTEIEMGIRGSPPDRRCQLTRYQDGCRWSSLSLN